MTTTATTTARPTATAAPLLPELAAAVAISLGGLAFANFFSTEGENGSVSDFLVMAPTAVALAAALFLWVLPRTRPDGPARIWFGVLSLLAFPAFWSGLPMVLGVAAIAAARRAGSVAWAVVGGLATAASFTVCIVG
jgi:hypothetical protein